MLALLSLPLADAAEEGRNIIIAMLIVALIFIGVIALGQTIEWLSHRSHSRSPQ